MKNFGRERKLGIIKACNLFDRGAQYEVLIYQYCILVTVYFLQSQDYIYLFWQESHYINYRETKLCQESYNMFSQRTKCNKELYYMYQKFNLQSKDSMQPKTFHVQQNDSMQPGLPSKIDGLNCTKRLYNCKVRDKITSKKMLAHLSQIM